MSEVGSLTAGSTCQDIPGQTGLNPLAGPSGEAFVKQLESRASGKFADPRQRMIYVLDVDNLRFEAGLLEQGGLPPSKWEEIVGKANKVRRRSSCSLVRRWPPGPPAPHQALVTANGGLTAAGLAYVRSHFGMQDVKPV
jgi:hypothetical protein